MDSGAWSGGVVTGMDLHGCQDRVTFPDLRTENTQTERQTDTHTHTMHTSHSVRPFMHNGMQAMKRTHRNQHTRSHTELLKQTHGCYKHPDGDG